MRSILAPHFLVMGLAVGGTGCALHRTETISSLSAGAMVRVTRACPPPRHHEICPRYVGELVSIDRDTLKLRPSSDSIVQALAAADVTRLERRAGRQNVILLGVGLGMVGGMLIGGVATMSECSSNEGSMPCFPSGFGYGALVGALTGGVVGALIHPDRWSRVAWPPPP
jgi:hypothetical protein